MTRHTVAGWKLACASLLLAFIVVVAFYPGLSGQFVMVDDPKYVTSNNDIRSLSWQSLAWAFNTFHAANWHPVTWLSFILDYQFYELEPFGYHLTNLVFHALNAVLVFLVLFRLTGAFWCSLAVAVLFGIHPMRVESVSWVSERKDVLSAFFWLLTMAAYLRYVRLKSVASYVLMAFTFSLGLMSKPVVVTLPAVLLLLDYWPLRRLNWKALWEKLPLLGLTLASVALTIAAQEEGGAVQATSIPLLERVANAIVSYERCLVLTVWPFNLSPWYSHPSLEGPPLSLMHVAGAAALLVGITALLLHKRFRESILPVGWFWFLGTLVPMIGQPTYYQNPVLQRDQERLNPQQFKPIPAPYARLNLLLFTEDDYGPTVGSFYPLGAWRLNLNGSWSSGDYITWVGGGSVPGVIYNLQRRDRWFYDVRVGKSFRLGGGSVELFADIYNVFNIKQMSHYGFVDSEDYNNYLKSLHLPEEFNKYYGNIPGDDRPGDYRKAGVPFQPMVYAGNIQALANPATRPIYYDQATRGYYRWTGTDWTAVDAGEMASVMQSRAYIDMPNMETMRTTTMVRWFSRTA